MAFDITEVKSRSRRLIHGLAAAPALYRDDTFDDEDPSAEITVRWHNKIIGADTINSDSSIITGIDRLVFLSSQLIELHIILVRGATVLIPKYDAMTFELAYEDVNDGPETVTWGVNMLSDATDDL